MNRVNKLRVGEIFQAARYRDAGIRILNPIDRADWIWHPQAGREEPVFLIFRNEFAVTPAETVLRFQTSADQHYELFLDGERISSGPDMGNVDHWFFSSYEAVLTPGKHRLEARVWWLGDLAPESTMTWRGGFIFCAEGAYAEALTTGRGDWRVCREEGISLRPGGILYYYHVIGGVQTIDGARLEKSGDWLPAATVRAGLKQNNTTGCCLSGWRLYPSCLPDQIDVSCTPGRFRACRPELTADDCRYEAADLTRPEVAEWNRFLSGNRKEMVVPANTELTLIWDLENYYSGFTEGGFTGGAGTTVEWQWAESLYEKPNIPGSRKGDRSQVADKFFFGFGHEYIASGAAEQYFRPYWWGAGRYCRLRIHTAAEPLTVRFLRIAEYRYPLRDEGEFVAEGADFSGIRKIGVRALQMCSHTTYMDCPYYEQMMYVGDTRLEVLTTYALTRDAALPRRAVELFDYSRSHWGVACERYPARTWQSSLTFAMIWTWMVHDCCFWRGDLNWVCERLAGVRANLDAIGQYATADGLLEKLPGWSFMDWIRENWKCGEAPGSQDGVSANMNLMYLLSLQKTAELEDLCGSALRAQDWREKAAALKPLLLKKFWNEKRGMLADDLTHACFSEHAQCLAILADLFSPAQQEQALAAMLTGENLEKTTIYFRYYFFDALCKAGRMDVVLSAFDEWHDLIHRGLMTTIEAPEPTRSDCHAWGTHPLFFLVAGFLGLRPAAPGMAKVRIAPQPAGLPAFRGKVPHPEGEILFDLKFADGRCSGSLTLPEGVEGVFVWQGRETSFTGSLFL